MLIAALVAAIDWPLYRLMGYEATITGRTRALFSAHPYAAMPFGVIAGGLYAHMFLSFSMTPRSPAAIGLFWLGTALGAGVVHTWLYG